MKKLISIPVELCCLKIGFVRILKQDTDVSLIASFRYEIYIETTYIVF